MAAVADRFGLGWRDELAAEIFANSDRIDFVEVIADGWFDAPRRRLDVLRTLARQIPVELHAVGLGLASEHATDEHRLDAMARLVEYVAPRGWSEHLAFVRAGGVEIGHLAAPPRTSKTIEGTLRNVERATRLVGSRPRLENVATLIDPPASTMDEATWISAILQGSGAELLLDLHNLHANATNFGFDARAFLDRVPFERVAGVHLAGGRWIEHGKTRRLLDDHLHDVPDAVFDLLSEVGRWAQRPLDVVLERDGRYPRIGQLLAELDRARAVLAEGRKRIEVAA